MQNIEELRKHLFAALEGLADKENPMDIERAKAISDISQTIINSAKVEVEFVNKSGSTAKPKFLALTDRTQEPGATAHGSVEKLPTGIVHRMAG